MDLRIQMAYLDVETILKQANSIVQYRILPLSSPNGNCSFDNKISMKILIQDLSETRGSKPNFKCY